MDELRWYVERNILSGKKVYVGPADISKASIIFGEIDNDEKRMNELKLMTRRLDQQYMILNTLDDEPGHNRSCTLR